MNKDLENFVERLDSLNPADGADIVDFLYELTEEIENIEGVEQVIPNIFEFIERYPEVDIGSPGPLVHLIENYYPQYVDYLISSMKRKPTANTVWMINRILNSKINADERKNYLQLLLQAQANEQADHYAREQAKHFYDYQVKKGS